MPPSPSLRRSPARDLRMDSAHKRGRSLESGLPTKAKDDDLVLFNEMQNRESDNFLLHIPDDFNETLNFNLGINIPVHGESSDLLNADSEKNDYEWLLTPPDTPLFPSLDDDESQPFNLSRGRTRSQGISIAKPSMNDKTPRTSRSSASPHRFSPTPRTRNNAVQSRSRPSSVPRSSPPPIMRLSSPSRRPSTPPANATVSTAMSSTPTMRRMSTGSSGPAVLSTRRGTSPVKPNRGNSASPKLRGWQSDLAAFSSDAPPNLRTSLSDRSASRIRGFSPASSTSSGRNSLSKYGRNSTSPSAPRSASLTRSLERENFNTYSRVSMASSGDDDESIPSDSVGASNSSSVRNHVPFGSNKHVAFPKKTSRSPTANSALKRSFDSAVRQMDNHKAPQNMFRPLLSSVPATSFYTGKPNSVHRTLFSRNSSLTTSSNASSEQGASFAPDIEYADHDQDDLAGEWDKVKDPEAEEEIFIFDKLDEAVDSNNYDFQPQNFSSHEGSSSFDVTDGVKSYEQSSTDNIIHATDTSNYQSGCAPEDYKVDCKETLQTCSKCGKPFLLIEEDQVVDICEECAAIDGLLASEELQTALVATENAYALRSQVQLDTVSPKLSDNMGCEVDIIQNENKHEKRAEFPVDGNSAELGMGTKDVCPSEDYIDCLEKESTHENGGGCSSQVTTAYQDLRADNSEGTGISVLLMQKSNSSKWPVVHGRTFSASNIICSEPSYTRDNTSTMKRSFSRQSSSPSSSVDLASGRQIDGRVVRQLSFRKGEMDNGRSNCNVLVRSSDSHSETSTSTTAPRFHVNSESDEGSYCTFVTVENDLSLQEKTLDSGMYNPYESANSNTLECSSLEHAVAGDDISIYSGKSDGSSNLHTPSNQQLTHQISDDSVTSNLDNRNHMSLEIQNIERNVADTDESFTTPDCASNVDKQALDSSVHQADVNDDSNHISSGTLQYQEDHSYCENLHIQSMPDQVLGNSEDYQETINSMPSDNDTMITSLESKDILVAAEETIGSELLVNEEPVIVVEAPKGLVQRSFTLEEATDTILFCSSIVHDIAYKAVTIGMEKESALPEAPRPTVTILGKSGSNQKEMRNISGKRVPISRKVKRKIPEADTRVPNVDLGDNTKDPDPARSNAKGLNTVDSMKPPKLESKCNCTVM